MKTLGIALGLIALACSGTTENDGGDTTRGGASSGGAANASGGKLSGAGGRDGSDTWSAALFASDQLTRFDLELPPDSIDALLAVESAGDALAEKYVPATLRYGNEVVENVGLRIKGEASFRAFSGKSAFKIKFDEFVPRQTFRGLRRLTLNNAVEDPSFVAERLAYDVFRAAGLPAPRCNSALVYVNGDFRGLYTNVEAEDKVFLSHWFDNDDGNLFEETGHDLLPGGEAYFELETNEQQADYSGLSALIEAADTAAANDFSAAITKRLNIEHFLRFAAAEAAVNQWDMYAHARIIPNNFRLYENPKDGRFVFLPWGVDMSMKPFPDSGRTYIPAFELGRLNDDGAGEVTAGILFQKCLSEAKCKAAYALEVEQLATLYESLDLARIAATYFAQVRQHAYADPYKEVTNEEVEAGYETVRRIIDGRVAALRADLEAQ